MSAAESGSESVVIEHLVNEPFEGDDAFGVWHDMTRPVFELGLIQPLQDYHIESEWFVVDGLMFTRVNFGASTYRRSERHIRSSDQDYFHLHMPIIGTERGQVHSRPLLVGPDRITLQDWSWPYYTITEPTAKFGLLIPRGRIERRDWIHERCPIISWQRNSLSGAALAFAWQTLWSSLESGETEIVTQLVPQFVRLVNRLVDRQWRQSSSESNRDILLPVMTAFLDDRLDQEQLGPRDLVEAFGCSRATVHRSFNRFGGVRNYVRNQRLARCFEEMALEPQPGRFIYEVAERWGFRNSAHFSRAFQKRFGLSARQIHASALSDFSIERHATSHRVEIDLVNRWLMQ